MNFLAVSFLVLFIMGVVSTFVFLIMKLTGEDDAPVVLTFLCFLIPTLIIWLLNFYAFPEKETRYVPHTVVGATLNLTNVIDRANLEVGQPFYLQIRIKVDSNSYARRFFHDNTIPFRVEISNPELASFFVERSKGFEEYKEPESDNNKTTYFFNVFAEKPPKKPKGESTENNAENFAFINLRGEAKLPGHQQIKILFDEKVSGTYSRTYTFEYKAETKEEAF